MFETDMQNKLKKKTSCFVMECFTQKPYAPGFTEKA